MKEKQFTFTSHLPLNLKRSQNLISEKKKKEKKIQHNATRDTDIKTNLKIVEKLIPFKIWFRVFDKSRSKELMAINNKV